MKNYSDFIAGKKYKFHEPSSVTSCDPVSCIGHLASGMPVFESKGGRPIAMSEWSLDPGLWSEVREPRVRYAVSTSNNMIYGMYGTKDEALAVADPQKTDWYVVKFVEEFG